MATAKIKTGDTVKVIVGKDKGKEGKVLAVRGGRVIVENVNMIIKHEKPSQMNPDGGITNQEAPMDISNVMYLHNGETTKIGFSTKDGKKVRVAKSNGDIID